MKWWILPRSENDWVITNLNVAFHLNLDQVKEQYEKVKHLYEWEIYQAQVLDLLRKQAVHLELVDHNLVVKWYSQSQGIKSVLGQLTLDAVPLASLSHILDHYLLMQQELVHLEAKVAQSLQDQEKIAALCHQQVALEQSRYELVFKKFKDVLNAKKLKIRQLSKNQNK